VIDLHSHLLPGIDDGARSMDEALAMARAHVADGTRCVVATPHIYPGVFDNTAERIARSCDEFNAALKEAQIPLSVQWAAEVRASIEIFDWLAAGTLPFLGQDGPWRHLLLELPDGQIPVGTDRLIAQLLKYHVRPVIAHPERNKAVMADPSKMSAFVGQGCLLQVTAGSLLGDFGNKAEATAHALLKQELVHVVASDAHRVEGRAPRMRAARSWLTEVYGEAMAQQLTLNGPAKICQPLTRQAV